MQDTEPSISRREFTTLTAATAGALLATETGRSNSISGAQLTDVYSFLLDRVEASYEIPTLVAVSSEDGFDALDTLGVEYRSHDGETQAAYARLTPTDASAVADARGVTELRYAPGGNPFWRLEDYGDRVFPAATDSVGHISYDEMVAGLEHLQSNHGDRMALERIGKGAGHENLYEGTVTRRDLFAIELADPIEQAAGRETIVFTMAIHGDERAGIEAGLRLVEDILTGNTPSIADLLSEYRLVFLAPNPDGWVVQERVFEDPVSPPDFRRFNGADMDPNRQFPVPGWIDPSNSPAESRGRNLAPDDDGVDEDVPEEIAADVPDVLSVVEHLRSYDDVAYLADLHGMYANTNAVLGLGSGGGTLADRADELALFERVGTTLESELGSVDEWTDAFDAGIENFQEQIGCPSEFFCQDPEDLYAYGTPADTIGYTTTGAFGTWAGAPTDQGGLDATAVTFEIAFSNSTSRGMANRFKPAMTEFHVAAYQAVCRAVLEHADSDVGVNLVTNGRTTAYLDSETLRRQSADLPHVDGDGVAKKQARPVRSSLETTESTLTADLTTATAVETTSETHTLGVHLRSTTGVPVRATIRGPDGETVRERNPTPYGGGGECGCECTVLDPEPGQWTVEIQSEAGPAELDVRTTRLDAAGQPDPEDVLGYEQRAYDATPLHVFDQFVSDGDEPIQPLSTATLSTEMLVSDGLPRYDNLVVSHTDVDEAGVEALAAFLEAGGNLVLTDAAVALAARLDVAGLDAVESEHVSTIRAGFADLGEEWESHPLFLDRRSWPDSQVVEREVWQHTQLGYAVNEAPIHTVATDPMESAGANVAYESFGNTRVATVPTDSDRTGIHLVGTLLPPASQDNLHPFGLADHTLTTFGYKLLCNALGYQFEVTRGGEEVQTVGEPLAPVEKATPTPTPKPSPTPSPTPTATATPTQTPQSDETPVSTATVTETPLATDTDTPDGSDADGSGFSLLAGLAGLGGAGYLLTRTTADDESTE